MTGGYVRRASASYGASALAGTSFGCWQRVQAPQAACADAPL